MKNFATMFDSPDPTKKDIDEIFDVLDENNDGKLTF